MRNKEEIWKGITRTSVELNAAQIQVRILEERKKALLFELECLNQKEKAKQE